MTRIADEGFMCERLTEQICGTSAIEFELALMGHKGRVERTDQSSTVGVCEGQVTPCGIDVKATDLIILIEKCDGPADNLGHGQTSLGC